MLIKLTPKQLEVLQSIQTVDKPIFRENYEHHYYPESKRYYDVRLINHHTVHRYPDSSLTPAAIVVENAVGALGAALSWVDRTDRTDLTEAQGLQQ